jgi:hypothetical protein
MRILDALFPHHRARRRYWAFGWSMYAQHEAYLEGAGNLAELERRMRTWINGW